MKEILTLLNLLFLILCFIVLDVMCCGQSMSRPSSINYYIGVGVSDRLQTRNSNFQSQQGNSIKEHNLSGVSYTAGVHIPRDGIKRLQPLFGLKVQAYGIRSKVEYPDRLQIGDTVFIQNNRQTDRIYHHYLGVPLGYRLIVSKTSKHVFFVKGGVCPDLYLFRFNKRIMKFDETEIRQFDFSRDGSFRPFACSVFLSGGIVRGTSNGLRLSTSIIGDFHLISNYTAKTPFQHRWYSVGLLIGIDY